MEVPGAFLTPVRYYLKWNRLNNWPLLSGTERMCFLLLFL